MAHAHVWQRVIFVSVHCIRPPRRARLIRGPVRERSHATDTNGRILALSSETSEFWRAMSSSGSGSSSEGGGDSDDEAVRRHEGLALVRIGKAQPSAPSLEALLAAAEKSEEQSAQTQVR